MDSFGLLTSAERLAAISKLRFPITLAALETYLSITGYLRNYIAWYAQIVKPLQDRKTELLKPSPKGGRERKSFAATTRLSDPTEAESTAFATLQDILSKPSYLSHFNPHWTLYIDIDASKDFGFGVVIYHDWAQAAASDSASDASATTGYTTTQKRTRIRPIMFLSKLLTDAERNYWPTELEVAGLVWTVRKVRHLIESSKSKVVVYTDHSASVDIAKQGSLATTSTVRLNLRLIRASQYLQRFELDVRHKPGKRNIIPDALSRLASTNLGGNTHPNHAELDVLHAYAYTTTLVEMSEDFKARIIKGYHSDPPWIKVLAILNKEDSNGEDAARLPFVLGETVVTSRQVSPQAASPQASATTTGAAPEAVTLRQASEASGRSATEAVTPEAVTLRQASEASSRPARTVATPASTQAQSDSEASDRLIYHVDKATGIKRLYIPDAVVKDILDVAHTAEGYIGFTRCYERVASSWYIRGLSRYLRDYLKHCPKYLVYQTRRHAPYGAMQPIYNPPIPFHTLTIDFILTIPLSEEGLNYTISVTCKFSKRITYVLGKST